MMFLKNITLAVFIFLSYLPISQASCQYGGFGSSEPFTEKDKNRYVVELCNQFGTANGGCSLVIAEDGGWGASCGFTDGTAFAHALSECQFYAKSWETCRFVDLRGESNFIKNNEFSSKPLSLGTGAPVGTGTPVIWCVVEGQEPTYRDEAACLESGGRVSFSQPGTGETDHYSTLWCVSKERYPISRSLKECSELGGISTTSKAQAEELILLRETSSSPDAVLVVVSAADGTTVRNWETGEAGPVTIRLLERCKAESATPDSCRVISRGVEEDSAAVALLQKETKEYLENKEQIGQAALERRRTVLEQRRIQDKDAAEDNWTYSEDIDGMTDEKRVYIFSKEAAPHKPMPFPYQDTTATLALGCDPKDYWIYIVLDSLNLAGGTASSTGEAHYIRVRSDSIYGYAFEIEDLRINVESGRNAAHFDADEKILERVLRSDEMRFEFDHYGIGKRVYKFDTSGFWIRLEQAAKAGCFQGRDVYLELLMNS